MKKVIKIPDNEIYYRIIKQCQVLDYDKSKSLNLYGFSSGRRSFLLPRIAFKISYEMFNINQTEPMQF